MVRINTAWEVSDPLKRADYDASRRVTTGSSTTSVGSRPKPPPPPPPRRAVWTPAALDFGTAYQGKQPAERVVTVQFEDGSTIQRATVLDESGLFWFVGPPRLTQWLKDEIEAGLRSQLSLQEATQAGLKQEAGRIKAKLGVLYDDRLDGRISAGDYDLKAVALHAQQADITRQLKVLEAEDTSYLDKAVSFVEMTQQAADEFTRSRDGSKKQELIGELFDKLILDGERLEPTYNLRASWLLTEILPLSEPGNDKFGRGDYGPMETKKAPGGTLRFSRRAAANTIRTLFGK
ncbi:hypothetical protein GCM10010441_23390 [Kitasatospora paracochleata]